MPKNTKICLLVFVVSQILVLGCQMKQRPVGREAQPGSETVSPAPPTPTESTIPGPEPSTPEEEVVMVPPPREPPAKIPKIGIILGPGGAKAWAHLAVLHELQKNKIPLAGIVGIEWAAPIAALYAHKGYANEAEWQMFKLQDADFEPKGGGLFSSSNSLSLTAFSAFFKTVFGNMKSSELRLPFGCPAFHIEKVQTYVMSRGQLQQSLPYCMALPPIFQAYRQNFSAALDFSVSIDFLRKNGANTIWLVNVLKGSNSARGLVSSEGAADSFLWSEIVAFQDRRWPGLDAVLDISLPQYSVTDFNKRREIMNSGKDQAAKNLEKLMRRWNL